MAPKAKKAAKAKGPRFRPHAAPMTTMTTMTMTTMTTMAMTTMTIAAVEVLASLPYCLKVSGGDGS
eukprot:4708359-Lingulodinium_polyedra.AAC.1